MGEPTGTPLSVRVVRSIADARDVDPMDIGFRLGDVIDTDALDELAEHDGGVWELRFEIDGHQVEVSADETVIVDGESYR